MEGGESVLRGLGLSEEKGGLTPHGTTLLERSDAGQRGGLSLMPMTVGHMYHITLASCLVV